MGVICNFSSLGAKMKYTLFLGLLLEVAEAFLLHPSRMAAPSLHNSRAAISRRPGLRTPHPISGRATFRPALSSLKMDIEGRAEHVETMPWKRKLARVPDLPTRFPMPERVIAIGDVHGDLEALRECLRMSELIDERDHWIGGDAHLVQVGDILDRGEEERGCLDLLLQVRGEAERAGGMVHLLLGNHEIMNVDLDFRYVTSRHAWEGWAPRGERGEGAEGTERDREAGAALAGVLKEMGWPRLTMDRVEAFRPGGHVTMEALSQTQVAVVIGDSVFVHGGLKREHVEYGLERLNWETRAWLVEGSTMPEFQRKPLILESVEAPVWNRQYSTPSPKQEALEELEDVLGALRARRMVMGHTPQIKGINAVSSPRGYEAWRCDTGMSRAMMGGAVEVLELLKDGTVRVRTPKGIVPASERSPEQVGMFVDVCDVDTGVCTPMPEEMAKLQIRDGSGEEDQGRGEAAEDAKVKAKVAATTGSAQSSEAAMAGVARAKTEAERERARVEEEWKAGRKEAVARLREVDRECGEWSDEQRLGTLVVAVVEDASRRGDRGMSRLTVKEMLGHVTGAEWVKERQELLWGMLDRVAPPEEEVGLAGSVLARVCQTQLAEAKAEAVREAEAVVRGEVVRNRRGSKGDAEAAAALRGQERAAAVEELRRQDAAVGKKLTGRERVKRTLARILLDAAERGDEAMTKRDVKEMLEAALGAELVGEHLAATWTELDRLFASALPAMGSDSYLHTLNSSSPEQRRKLEYNLAFSRRAR